MRDVKKAGARPAFLLRGRALGGAGEAGLVPVGGVLFDQAALGCLVDRRKTGRERLFVRVATLDVRTGLLQRRPESRLARAVARFTLFGLPSLFLGRGNIRHVYLLLWLKFYLVSIPSCFSFCRARAASCDFGCSCSTYWSCTTPCAFSPTAMYAYPFFSSAPGTLSDFG